jgi:hypothetical protein
MATMTVQPLSPGRRLLRPPPRVALSSSGETRPGHISGAWWPYSRHLTRELPQLLATLLDRRLTRVNRATVQRTMWPSLPCRVRAQSDTVHLRWSDAEQDPHEIRLHFHEADRWNLLVIPPETAPEVAARAMAAASHGTGTHTASALITAARHTGPRRWTGRPGHRAPSRRRWRTRSASTSSPCGSSSPTPS